jgi:uncharacterized protein YbaP (TraB family)
MIKILLPIMLIALSLSMKAQQPKPAQIKPQSATSSKNDKKYSSLLWEITGNGLKKPSYLFGTMHVSDKLAFHLGDSFYNALKSVQVVALETNPEFWQDDYSKSSFFGKRGGLDNYAYSLMRDMPMDQMRMNSFAIDDYNEAVKAALAVEPSLVNGLLYRTYGSQMDDFEEDTYLDMYIFQAGKKLGKRLTGVENFEESEKLVLEAYKDMFKDKNKKRRSYDYEEQITNPKKVEDAYRKGDLDVMDSLQSITVTSEAFEEKFLYKRNEIQAHSIDTILKKNSLFVAVGAAHLPGSRGVIEMLRKMGYTLRPVRMDDRNSVQKDAIDNTHFPMKFTEQNSDDGFYHVNIPGKKFYRFTDWNGMDVVQYADMVNGAYYMVTRVKTNSLLWGHDPDLIHRRIDSFMYENVPGKLLKKTPISKNGYKGWEILNRTRRGDYQRYNLFITPFEVIIFKMSGNGDFINHGMEAQQFFGSVKLKEYKPGEWIKYQPGTGGFTVQLPHQPSLMKDENYGANRFEYSAFDKNGNSYMVMQSNLHNYSYVEEDSFELNLMNESYGSSPFIDRELSHQFSKVQGYPALETKFLHKDGSFSTVRYLIRGPLYYVIVSHHKTDDPAVSQFFRSFTITPFNYPDVKSRTDTSMHFTVRSPVFIDSSKKKEEEDQITSIYQMAFEDEDLNSYTDRYKTAFIGNDTIGEKILVTYIAPSHYSFEKDSAKFWKENFGQMQNDDSTFIIRLDKKYALANGTRVREMQLSDTNSSRLIWSKWMYKDGHFFTLTSLTDTLSAQSPFLQNFFASFTPADTLKGESIFDRKTARFFNDFFSKDSATAKKARRAMYEVKFDSLDAPMLEKAADRVNWDTKNYLDTKKYFISQLSNLKDASIVPWLRQAYFKVKDTAELQNSILSTLLQQKTKESFAAFKDLILQEPPISDGSYNYGGDYGRYDRIMPTISFMGDVRFNFGDNNNYYGPWGPLYDTLSLTRTIFPDMLQLMDVDDYKGEVMDLLTKLVDSGYVKASDYENHFSKLYLDAKQLLKKQVASEENQNIERLNRKDRNNIYYDEEEDDREMDQGNSELEQYSVLLLPFYDKKQGIPSFFDQLLKSKDRRVVYDAFILLLRNNRTVPDSLLMKYAKVDEYRAMLYKDLLEMKKINLFPAAYKTQQLIAQSLLVNDPSYYSKPDTMVYLDRLKVTYRDSAGWVYFFKYREQRDDNYWKIASVGMQPQNADSIDIYNDDFTNMADHKLDNDKPVKQQLEKLLRQELYSKRSSATEFYESGDYNLYKTYLPEIVKSRRYRD